MDTLNLFSFAIICPMIDIKLVGMNELDLCSECFFLTVKDTSWFNFNSLI